MTAFEYIEIITIIAFGASLLIPVFASSEPIK
jgi:hypothetical protein